MEPDPRYLTTHWAAKTFALPIARFHRDHDLEVTETMAAILTAHRMTPVLLGWRPDSVAMAIVEGVRAGVDLSSWGLDDLDRLADFAVKVGGELGESILDMIGRTLDEMDERDVQLDAAASIASLMRGATFSKIWEMWRPSLTVVA